MPGMDIRAALTVVGDGPVGAIGRQLDEHFGLPEGNHQHDWAIGMKLVVDLPAGVDLEPGTVLHTFGYPEPEIFGFLYVHPGRIASLGIFVPSWFDNPVAHRLPLPAALDDASRTCGATSRAARCARGARRPCRNRAAAASRTSSATATRASAKVPAAPTSSPAPASTRRGPRARCSPRASLELLKAGRPFTRENLDASLRRAAAARAGSSGRAAWRNAPATASSAAS